MDIIIPYSNILHSWTVLLVVLQLLNVPEIPFPCPDLTNIEAFDEIHSDWDGSLLSLRGENCCCTVTFGRCLYIHTVQDKLSVSISRHCSALLFSL